jgi:hypothetical protein
MRLSASKGSSKGKASSGASAVSSAVSSAHSPASSSRQDQSLPSQEGEAEVEWVEGYDEKFQRFFYFNEAVRALDPMCGAETRWTSVLKAVPDLNSSIFMIRIVMLDHRWPAVDT